MEKDSLNEDSLNKDPLNIDHSPKTVKTSSLNSNFETLILELTIGSISGVYAFMGYGVQVGQLFFPCLIVSIICFFLVGHTVYAAIKEKFESTK